MSSHDKSKSSFPGEQVLSLPHGRQIAYSAGGNKQSTTVVLFFSGYFSVGTIPSVPGSLKALDAHLVNPTIPGNGLSSFIPSGTPYNVGLCQDITALLNHLYPPNGQTKIETLYIGGGSYGTVPAQIVYGAPYEIFPLGKKIKACLLLAPLSPFRLHRGYSHTLTWPNWLSIGPPAYYTPLQIVPRLLSYFLAYKLRSVREAQNFLNDAFVKKMDAEEEAQFDKYCAGQGKNKDEYLLEMAKSIRHCVSNNWDGFLYGPSVLHSDWGFHPRELDEQHNAAPIMIVPSTEDEIGQEMSTWLAQEYKHSLLRLVRGGHLSSVYSIDELWTELIQEADTSHIEATSRSS